MANGKGESFEPKSRKNFPFTLNSLLHAILISTVVPRCLNISHIFNGFSVCPFCSDFALFSDDENMNGTFTLLSIYFLTNFIALNKSQKYIFVVFMLSPSKLQLQFS